MFRNLLATLVLLVAAIGLAIYAGVYDVSAAKPPGKAEQWLLETVRHRSVEKRAESLTVPSLGSEDQVMKGFQIFRSQCVTCHGAPGVPPDDFAMGLFPMPPSLGNESVQHEGDAELFWIIQHGLKHTGMPGFGMSHSEEDLWSVVAFLRRLPTLDAEGFQGLSERALAAEAPPTGEPAEAPPSP
jgi:mono/diheme cytochrome c family protein